MIENTCRDVRNLIWSDQEQSDEQLSYAARHLENCAACAAHERDNRQDLVLRMIASVHHTDAEKAALLGLRAMGPEVYMAATASESDEQVPRRSFARAMPMAPGTKVSGQLLEDLASGTGSRRTARQRGGQKFASQVKDVGTLPADSRAAVAIADPVERGGREAGASPAVSREVPARPTYRRAARAAVGTFATAALALFCWHQLAAPDVSPGASPDAVPVGQACASFKRLLGPIRPIRVRLTYPCADEYRAYGTVRSGSVGVRENIGYSTKGELEERGEVRGLVAALLLSGGWQPAYDYIEKRRAALDKPMPVQLDIDLDSDMAAVLIARDDSDDAERALVILERVLDRQPEHPQAHFNRGLALLQLSLYGEAARAFDRAAEFSMAPGWQAEARQRARKARERLRKKLDSFLRHAGSIIDREVLADYDRTKDALAAHDVEQAYVHAMRGWKRARERGDWHHEILFLGKLKHLELLRDDVSGERTAVGIAYLQERLARIEFEYDERSARALLRPGDENLVCQERYYTHHAFAEMEINRKRLQSARRHLDETARIAAGACRDVPIAPTFSRVMARVHLRDKTGTDEDVRDILAEIGKLRDKYASEPDLQAFLDYIEGQLMLFTDRQRGQTLLRRAIDRADEIRARSHSAARGGYDDKARAYSYAALALDAERRGEHGDALDWLARERGLSRPARCAVGVVDDLALAFFARSSAGRDVGVIVTAESRPDGRLVPTPAAIVAALSGCERIDVHARAPYYGWPELLPGDLPWRFISRDRPSQLENILLDDRPVIVHSVAQPKNLGLPELDARPRHDDRALEITGTAATPTGVLKAARAATYIGIHAHGLNDRTISGVSQIVLAQESDSDEYLLTAERVRQERFTANPVVVLGACHASSMTSYHHDSWSLADAFLDAGARVVIASPAPIEDQSGAEVFYQIRTRITAGEDPATVVRDVRVAHRDQAPWVKQLQVFE